MLQRIVVFVVNSSQEGGKKTMFGMAALNADQIQQAAEAAKAASAASQSAPQAPSLNLPLPGQNNAPAAGGAPSLNLGKPDEASAFAKTEMMPSITGNSEPAVAPAEPKKDPFADEFAALEASYGNDPDFNAPVDPTPSGPQDIVPSQPEPSNFGAPASNPPAAAGFGASTAPSKPAQGGFGAGPSNAGPGGFGSAPKGGPTGPSSMGWWRCAMQKAPGQAMEKKKDNKVIIIVAVVGLLSLFSCVGIGIMVKVLGLM